MSVGKKILTRIRNIDQETERLLTANVTNKTQITSLINVSRTIIIGRLDRTIKVGKLKRHRKVNEASRANMSSEIKKFFIFEDMNLRYMDVSNKVPQL